MIKINLIGDEEVTSTDSIIWLVTFIASILLVITIWLVARSLMLSSLDESLRRAKRAEIQLGTLKDRTKEVDGLKATRDEVQGMTLAIASLRKAQEGPVKLLDAINIAVPDRLWLSTIDSKNNIMKIEGLALDDSSISQFIQNFRQSEFVVDVDLKDRRAVALIQINTFNSFTGEQTKAVVRADKSTVSAKLGDIKREAEEAGLTYVNEIPESSLKDAVTESNNSSTAGGAITKLSFESSGSRRFIGGRPTIFAWESLEEVKGLSFSAEAKIRYSPIEFTFDPNSGQKIKKKEVPTPVPDGGKE
jgi:type IV pilus assembly protein PilN